MWCWFWQVGIGLADNDLLLRYGECQLGNGCQWSAGEVGGGTVSVPITTSVPVTVIVDGAYHVINATHGSDYFQTAREFCTRMNIMSPVCAPSIGQRLGNALFCNGSTTSHGRSLFRIARTKRNEYSIEFDLIRHILVDDFGLVECTESTESGELEPYVYVFDADVFLFDDGRMAASVKSINVLDRFGTQRIGNKAALRANLRAVGGEVFLPKAWSMKDVEALGAEGVEEIISSRSGELPLWIAKHSGQEGGSGVQIIHGTRALHSFIKDWTSYAEGPQYELYEYVQPPLLIDGRRFSIGVFVLVTSIDPLIVWLYTEDYLVLVCLEAFKPVENTTSPEMHLTNGVVLSSSPRYSREANKLNRRKMKDVFGSEDEGRIWHQIENITAHVFIGFVDDFRSFVHGRSSNLDPAFDHVLQNGIHGLWRLDFLVNEGKKVFLLEVETMPSTSDKGMPIGRNRKKKMYTDAFRILGWTGEWHGKPMDHLRHSGFNERLLQFLATASDDDMVRRTTNETSHGYLGNDHLEHQLYRFDNQLAVKGGFSPFLLQSMEDTFYISKSTTLSSVKGGQRAREKELTKCTAKDRLFSSWLKSCFCQEAQLQRAQK
jgi:hypothetical protein